MTADEVASLRAELRRHKVLLRERNEVVSKMREINKAQQAKIHTFKEALQGRNEAVARLREANSRSRARVDASRETVANLNRRNRVTADRLTKSRAAEKQNWMSRFIYREADFAAGVMSLIPPLHPPALMIVHDVFAIRAGLSVRAHYSEVASVPVIFDNVEYPDPLGRFSVFNRGGHQMEAFSAAAFQGYQRSAVNSFEAVSCSSQGQMDLLEELDIGTNHFLLRNCRDESVAERSELIRAQCSAGVDDVLILYLNNAYPQGGFDLLCDAVALLPERFKIGLLGVSHHVPVDEIVESRGLQGRFTKLEPVGSNDLIQYVSGADVVAIPLDPAVPNFATCLPNRIFESLAARVPIVAPRETGMGQFVEHYEVGSTFQFDDSQDFARALDAAATNPAVTEAVSRVSQELVWSAESREFVDCARRVANDGHYVLVLANKGVAHNNRIHRMVRSLLLEFGEVTLISRSNPLLSAGLDGAQLLEVP